MTSQEDIQQQQELLATHRRTLAHLIRQATAYGGETYAPPSIANGIHEARENIARIKDLLRSWSVQVEDHHDDEERPLRAMGTPAFPLQKRQPLVWMVVLVGISALVTVAIGAIVSNRWLATPVTQPTVSELGKTSTALVPQLTVPESDKLSATPLPQSAVSTLEKETDTPLAQSSATPCPTPVSRPSDEKVPDPDLVTIPAKPFLMGSTDNIVATHTNEGPQKLVNIPYDYSIGRTEVTNAEFRLFVEGDGYTNHVYWTNAGWEWRNCNNITHPATWDKQEFMGDKQPVAGVSWYEAVAYTHWLSEKTGHNYRLPTEAEWEKAARGTDGQIWPWGDSPPDATRANSREAGLGATTPVGQFKEKGASPYGALDIAGNVMEWCATKWPKPYPYKVEGEWNEDYLKGMAIRVLRGGAFDSPRENLRTALRLPFEPDGRDKNFGFRVVRDDRPPNSTS